MINGQVYRFRSPADRVLYLKGKDYVIENNDIVVKDKSSMKLNKCVYCGEVIQSGNICFNCVSKHPRTIYASEYVKSHKDEVRKAVESGDIQVKIPKLYDKKNLKSRLPDKETLQELIKDHAYRDIAVMYDVHEKTLRDVLKDYGIYERRRPEKLDDVELVIDLLRYGRIEAAKKHGISQWKIQEAARKLNVPKWMYDKSKPVQAINLNTQESFVFESFKEAARAIQGNKENTQIVNSLGYRIGNIAKENGVYMGYRWSMIDKEEEQEKFIKMLKETIR